MRRDEPRLPPLVIRSVYDVEDVSVREAEALAGQAAVPRSIVVEQSSKKSEEILNRPWLNLKHIGDNSLFLSE